MQQLTTKMRFGVMVGLAVPPVFMALFYAVAFAGSIPPALFIEQLMDATRFSLLLSFGLLGNLIPFFFFYWKKMDRTANGVIGATLLLGAVIMYLKLMA